MIDNANYDIQKDEVELLKNILFDQLEIKEEFPHFIFNISIIPDVIEEPKLKFNLKFNLPEDYPNISPNFEIHDESNYIASSKIKAQIEKIKLFIEENLGMTMIYQIYEMVKDFGNEQEEIMNNEHLNKINIEEESKKKYNEKIQLMEKSLIETKTFTPVTKENFDNWFTKFYAESNKGKEKKMEQEQRLSGREYFMKMKMSGVQDEEEVDEDSDVKEENQTSNMKNEENNQDEGCLFFDAGAFEENIDDIDFDGADIDDNY